MPITDTLKLTRTGKFVVSEKTGVQCKDRGHSSYAYHVEIRSPWKLDQMGFLIDHNRIDRVVRDHAQMTPDSCERMCMAICNGIFVELADHSVPVKSILVRIKPEPTALAWMELIREFE
jgi:hypothetical protein